VTRTKPLHLVVIAAAAVVLTWLLQIALAAMGRAVIIPPITLGVALVLIGVIIVAMAWPVRRVARRVKGARVDPFYATRVVVLAKASSLGGALLAGAGIGILGYLLTRSVLPAVGSITMAAVTAGGAVLLLAAGLIAEYMCTIPPDDDESQRGVPDAEGLA
jgi:hypothetical protein